MKQKDNVTIWTASNGNKCFRFSKHKSFERPWIILIVFLLLATIAILEFLIRGSHYSLIISIVVFFFVLLWWLSLPLKADDSVFEKTIHRIMDEFVREQVMKVGYSVVESCVYYDTKGTYGIITGRFFLILLSNGDVWEFPIIYHKSELDKDAFYECIKDYTISSNQTHIRAIQPKRMIQFFRSMKLSDKARLRIILFFIFLSGGLPFALCFWLAIKLKWWALLLFFGYMGLCLIVEWIGKNVKSKAITLVFNVILLPQKLIRLSEPFMTFWGTFVFTTLCSFGILALVLWGLKYLGWLVLKKETILFLIIALGSILISNYNVTKWILRHSPIKNWGNHAYESYRERMAVYLVHPSNIIFLFYLAYLLFLTISGYLQIQCDRFLFSEANDIAVLNAFLVYIAYTNMNSKAHDAELDVKELLKITIMLCIKDDTGGTINNNETS